jgi:hypothetical protein
MPAFYPRQRIRTPWPRRTAAQARAPRPSPPPRTALPDRLVIGRQRYGTEPGDEPPADPPPRAVAKKRDYLARLFASACRGTAAGGPGPGQAVATSTGAGSPATGRAWSTTVADPDGLKVMLRRRVVSGRGPAGASVQR